MSLPPIWLPPRQAAEGLSAARLAQVGFSSTTHQGADPDGAREMQSLACSVDVTAVRRYSDDEWLLQLEMYDMEHRHTDRSGNTRLMQNPGEFDFQLERDFFFVQRSDGTVTQCFYPPVTAAARKTERALPESRLGRARATWKA
jgi:hypothetical protein